MTKPEISNKVKYNLLLLAAVAFLFLLNFYSKTLFFRPSVIHQWRQVDCLSITKNYYEEGMHFLSPHVHSLRAKGGKAVAELPILNYTVAFLWKVFGEHEFIYRLLNYSIYLLAIFILFNTLIRFFKSPWLAFLWAGLLLTSPLLTYYSFNFLSDVPGLSFCIIAFCLLFWFYKTKSLRYFYLALVLATLAALLKASALVALLCLTLLFLIDLFNLHRLFKIEKLFKNKVFPIPAIGLAFYLIVTWYHFAMNYTAFDNGVFLLKALPIWEMSGTAIFDNVLSLFNNLLPAFLNKPMLSLFFFLLLFVFVHFRKLDVFLRFCLILSLLFSVFYVLFFFQVFTGHDYYLINLFILPVVLSFSMGDVLSKLQLRPGTYIKTGLIVLFVFNAFYSAAFYRVRTINDDKLCVWYPFISSEERNLFRFLHWDYKNNLEPLEDIRPDLKRLGFRREDTIVSITDVSPNISLYFMDQRGYTVSQELLNTDSMTLKNLLPRHIKYLVLTKPEIKNEKGFRLVEPELQSIFKKERIEIFKVIR